MGTEGSAAAAARWSSGHSHWSEMTGEGKVDGLRTVECLRGRLLAERAASKAAREEAELLSKRMNELERLLALEIEWRNKAEERLERILRSLESVKRFAISSQCNASETSGSASSACFPSLKEPEQEKIRTQMNSTQLYADGKAKETRDLQNRRKTSGGESSDATADPSIFQDENQASARKFPSRNEGIPGLKQSKEFEDCLSFVGNGELSSDTATTRYVCCH